MISFEVPDMTCGHCVSTLTKAVRTVDAGARLTADLSTHRVHIEPAQSDAGELGDAIREAGYTPVPVPAPATEAVAAEATTPGRAAARSGCCCG